MVERERLGDYEGRGDYHRELDPNWSYAPIYRRKIVLVDAFMSRLPSDARVLDVGAGEGVLVEKYRAQGRNVVGVDANYESPSVKKASLASLPFEDGSFDAVLCLDVLEHLDLLDQAPALREIKRLSHRGWDPSLERSQSGAPAQPTEILPRRQADTNLRSGKTSWRSSRRRVPAAPRRDRIPRHQTQRDFSDRPDRFSPRESEPGPLGLGGRLPGSRAPFPQSLLPQRHRSETLRASISARGAPPSRVALALFLTAWGPTPNARCSVDFATDASAQGCCSGLEPRPGSLERCTSSTQFLPAGLAPLA